MTGHQINSLVGDLVAMAQAMERLPQVEANNRELAELLDMERQTVQDRELKIITLKVELTAKNAIIRDLEVAKDAAETMFLESDDKLERIAKSFQVALEAMDATDKVIETATAKPQSEPQVEVSVHSDPTPLASTMDGPIGHSPSEGQSEPDPIPMVEAVPSIHTDTAPMEDGQSSHVAQMDTVQQPSPGPYYGLRYINVRGWISRDDWIAGGGTNEDYDWRDHSVA